MSDIIIVGILSFLGTGLGTLAGIWGSSKLIAYRIDKLEVAVEKHNKVIERTYTLEEQQKRNVARLDKQDKNNEHFVKIIDKMELRLYNIEGSTNDKQGGEERWKSDYKF